MGILNIFKKAGKLKEKADKSEQKTKEVDESLFRIGVYGHKGVGKTVFFTIVYSFSKQSSDFEIMALGETQEILEEKFNIMRGKGIDLDTGEKIASRRFPPLSTGEQKLNFEIRVGKSKVIPVNTIDYSGELVYIDTRGEIKQNLIDYFSNCECVFFFMDPEAIQNEGERSNRIASFTDLIDKLSGLEKKLKIPVGLVVTKADELPGFKSADQSVLISKGSGYIRAMNFAGFLRGVLKQRGITNRPDWKTELELMLNRLESFFKPLINRTLDYQVFFISSTGNIPEVRTDESGEKTKIPPEDLRPLGVSQPLRWAISRIAAYRRAVAYKKILKWTLLIVFLIVDLVAFGHIYNQIKVRSLFRNISQLTGSPSTINKSIGREYKKYANNFIVQYFFSNFSEKALEQQRHFMNAGSSQAKTELNSQIEKMLDSIDVKIQILSNLKGDTAQYNTTLNEITGDLSKADTLANEITDNNLKNKVKKDISLRQAQIESTPTGAEVSQTQDFIKEYSKLKDEFNYNLNIENYDYILGDQYTAKLQAFKDNIPDDPQLNKYVNRIQNYLAGVAKVQKGIAVPFTVSGAEGGEDGYSIAFESASGIASGFPLGNVDIYSAGKTIRVPVAGNDITINLYDGSTGVIKDSYPIEPGYAILGLHNEKIQFVTDVDIHLFFNLDKFSSYFKKEL